MPDASIAEYGLAIFAIAMLGYVLVKVLVQPKDDKNVGTSQELVQVIENNTAVMRELMDVIRELQVEMARQQVKLDEILDVARHVRRRPDDRK